MAVWFYPGQEDYITKLNELGAIAELLSGPDGWSPELAVVPDGERRVFQVADWVGGETTKPPIGDYVGSTGYVSNIADAIDIRGPQGVDGADGAVGPSNVLSIGTVTGGATASATITGTSPSQVLNLVLPKGDPGTNGTDGLAATIAVGTVTTGAPGTSATVVNSGTSSAAVFDFTIPRGDTGASGAGSGDVVGPASATNNGVALFDSTTGKIIKDGGVLGTAAFEVATSFATAAQGTKADTAVQPGSLATVATSGAYADLTGKPTLGTASILNVPATGNAATGEVVKGDDTRLSDSRTPTGVAGGVLSGSYPNPGFAMDMATQAELDAVSSVANAKLSDAPSDGKTYGRKDAAWAEVVSGGASYQTGDSLITSRVLSEPDWLLPGSVYLKASYPAAAALIAPKTLSWDAATGPNTSNVLYSVCRVTDSIAIAVGNAGTVWRSTDSGSSWTKITGPNTSDPLGGSSANSTAVIAVGGSGIVWRSTDSGSSWTKITGPNTSDPLLSSSLTDGTWSVAVGVSGAVWRTSNSGSTWVKVTGPNTTDTLYSVTLFASDSWIAVGSSGAIWRSENQAGSAWTKITGPNTTDTLRAVTSLGSSLIVACGDAGVIWISVDAGLSWRKTTLGTTAFNAAGCCGNRLIVSGQTTWISDSFGTTWRQTYHPASKLLNAMTVLTSEKAIGVGNTGIVIRSESGVAYCPTHTPATQFVTPQSFAPAGFKQYVKA